MIAELRPYSAMKDSGVPWLGEVPEHWEVMPGKACYKEKKESNVGLQENTVLSLSYGRIVVKPEEKLRGLVPESFETYQIVDPGDTIIRPTDLQNDQTSLRFGLSNNRGIITSAYLCFHTKNGLAPEYGYLLMHTYDLKKIFYGLGSGLRQNLDWHDFKYLPCLAPPLSEQTAIIRYLEYMDRRIRRYIQAKRKLIKLLVEQKQAIIHRAVTRGLDPDVSLKPSGVEWLGDIPEHWEVVSGRDCIKVNYQANVGLKESTVLSLSYGNIVIRPVEKLHGLVPASFETYQIIEPGDIICRPTDLQNDKKSLRFGISKHRGIITSAYLCFRTTSRIHDIYAYQILHTYDLIKIIYMLGSGLRQNLSWADFKSLPCVLPPIDEQKEIVEYINQATVDIDTTIGQSRREIELLREYSKSLIANVVTGKLDVRKVATNLPNEADKEELAEEVNALEGSDETLEDFESEPAEEVEV